MFRSFLYPARAEPLGRLQPSAELQTSNPSAPACNETKEALSRRRNALRSSCTVLTNAAMQGGVLLSAASSLEEACAPRLYPIESPWFGIGPRPLEVRHLPAIHLTRACASPAITDRRAVIVGVSGGYGCRQYGHYLFNTLLPLLDTLQRIKWTGSDAPGTIYIDCHGRGLSVSGGVVLHAAPRFVQEAASAVLGGAISPSLGGAAPLRSLHELALASRSRTVCFEQLLVGMGCAQSDHYNVRMPLAPVRAMRSAVLRALTPGSEAAAAPAGRSAVVLLSLRQSDRRILNKQAVLTEIFQPGVDHSRSRVVRFGSLSFADQIRIASEADVLIGIDGTDLSNGLFLRPGGVVVDLLPYGTDAALPDKSRNFFRLWRAVGLRVVRVGLCDASHSRVALRAAWCGRCLRNRSLAIVPQRRRRDSLRCWCTGDSRGRHVCGRCLTCTAACWARTASWTRSWRARWSATRPSTCSRVSRGAAALLVLEQRRRRCWKCVAATRSDLG